MCPLQIVSDYTFLLEIKKKKPFGNVTKNIKSFSFEFKSVELLYLDSCFYYRILFKYVIRAIFRIFATPVYIFFY